VPVERMLLSYFERGVGAGTRFMAGQTVQVGWATLRLCARADGTLGVQELDASGWVESCDRSLMQVWLQKDVASSVGLTAAISFPRQDQIAIACDRALSTTSWLLSRMEPQDRGDSGWFIGCFGEPAHDHEHEDDLHVEQLLQLTHRLPFITQFLALPPGFSVHIDGTTERIRPRLFFRGESRSPSPGSYLASLAAG